MFTPDLPDKNHCTGCMACSASCPVGAFTETLSEDHLLMPKVNSELCIGCRLCEKRCPVLNPPEKLLPPDGVFAAWHRDASVRHQSATGGVFAALAQRILQDGGAVCGAAISGFEVRHIVITSMDQLHLLQGSKYLQSNPCSAFPEIKKRLQTGQTVLFSGMGCQVSGLLSSLRGVDFTGKLYTVDLICGGVPGQQPMEIYRKTHPEVTEIVSFRDKEKGWSPKNYRYNLKVRTTDGAVREDGVDNALIDGFSRGLYLRPVCNKCPFARYEHPGDFTIGDFWGISDYPEEHAGGINCLFYRGKAAYDLLKRCMMETHEVSFEDVLSGNPRLLEFRKEIPFIKLQQLIFTAYYQKLHRRGASVRFFLYRSLLKVINLLSPIAKI